MILSKNTAPYSFNATFLLILVLIPPPSVQPINEMLPDTKTGLFFSIAGVFVSIYLLFHQSLDIYDWGTEAGPVKLTEKKKIVFLPFFFLLLKKTANL
jgi:hypothetical protein